jgi:hypothetical protein
MRQLQAQMRETRRELLQAIQGLRPCHCHPDKAGRLGTIEEGVRAAQEELRAMDIAGAARASS